MVNYYLFIFNILEIIEKYIINIYWNKEYNIYLIKMVINYNFNIYKYKYKLLKKICIKSIINSYS